MSALRISFEPIGLIHSEHADPVKTPAQPVFAQDCLGTVEIYSDYAAGLKDIEGFSHIYLLYHLNRAKEKKLIVKPFLHDVEHGIFATRTPFRPNAIGLSIVELLGREENTLHIKGVDILDGTPVIDIKPYAAKFDHVLATRSGWLDEVDEETAKRRGMRDYQPNRHNPARS